jgi:hypothetical protein
MSDTLFVRASKTVDFPDWGRPMIPNFMIFFVIAESNSSDWRLAACGGARV